jgi:hypothetical protein
MRRCFSHPQSSSHPFFFRSASVPTPDGQIHFFFSPSLSPLPKSIIPKYLNRIEFPLAKT